MKPGPLIAIAMLALSAPMLRADPLESLFRTPATEARPWVYWYWMNGNVTREGIRADLQAFADIGVGGALTFDIGIHPPGAVTNRSREWYDLIAFAASEAAKHDIKMSFHCPGWSASGGPWITPERGMQELTWSETVVEGPREFPLTLPQPRTHLGCYRDAAVIAFPTPPGDEPLTAPHFADPGGKPLPSGADTLPPEFDLVYPQPVEARSIFVRVGRATGDFNAELSVDGRLVAKLRSHISGPFSPHIGSATFAPVRASRFRIAFTGRKIHQRVGIESIELQGGYRLPDWTSKAGFSTERVEARAAAPSPQASDVIASNRVVDLTGRTAWSVPAGRWTVLRIGCTPTGVHISPAPLGGDGLECDKLSREAADVHYDSCVTPVLRQFGSGLVQRAVAYYHVDSYEAGWQNWTEKLLEEFRARRGYDLVKYLPAVTGRIVGDLATTERFLWDFRRTIGDLFATQHYGRLAERCHRDGIGFSTEPYGGPFECLQVGALADHPMAEFWLPTRPRGRTCAFHAVFAGHTNARSVIGAESFTSGPPEERWNSHPASLKALGDFIYCCGINRFVIHVSAHQPQTGDHVRPGFTCGCNGIHFDRGNTWWDHGAREWTTYLTRCQSLLQAGEPTADVLYFQGNDSPDGVGPFDPVLPDGYAYDACNAETLDRLTVNGDRVVLPRGGDYRFLVLPREGRITLAALRMIAGLAKSGARVVGTVPRESPSLADDAGRTEYASLAAGLAARMITGRTFGEILAADRLPPDFENVGRGGGELHAIHRRIGLSDVYFVASAGTNATVADCRFRVSGKVPELWRPDSGAMEPCAVYEQIGDTTRVPLRFDPAGSVFVVFRPGPVPVHVLDVVRVDAARAPPILKIQSAFYGPPDDPQRTVDVTPPLASHIRGGRLDLEGFTQLAGDPAPFVKKRILVRYEVDGVSHTASAEDGDRLILPPPSDDARHRAEVRLEDGRLELRAWQPGRYAVVLSDRRTQTVDVASVPAPRTIAGPWTLEFPAGWGVPARVPMTNLISWTDHPDDGVRHFSGTATYRGEFELSDIGSPMWLDLGRIEVVAEVRLNGHPLGTLWKPPYRCEATAALRKGRNELEMRITNLWPNRLIGDEQLPDDCAVKGPWYGGGIRAWPEWYLGGAPRPEPRRMTFATWRHWTKDDALLPSGLLGPVTLTEPARVVIDPAR